MKAYLEEDVTCVSCEPYQDFLAYYLTSPMVLVSEVSLEFSVAEIWLDEELTSEK